MKKSISLLLGGIGILLLVYGALSIRPYEVIGDSMIPTLKNHDIVVLNTRQKSIKRGAIVVYKGHDGTPRIKRIIGLSDETVALRDGSIFINTFKLSEAYLNPNIRTCVPGSCIDMTEKTFSVPKSSYFVLGDNRENSIDSRGCTDVFSCGEKNIFYVEESEILGIYLFSLPFFKG